MATITTQPLESYVLIYVIGDIQTELAVDANLRNIVNDEIKKGHSSIVLNLENAASVCSSFTGAVVEIKKKLKTINGYFGIIKPWREIDLLRIAGVYDQVESFYSLDQFKAQKLRNQ